MNGVIALLLWRSGGDVNITKRAAARSGRHAFDCSRHCRWLRDSLDRAILDRFSPVIRRSPRLILWSSFGIVRETLNILLEGTPRGMSLEAVESAMRQITGVSDVHDLHLWSIGSENHALSAHVKIADMATSESDTILREINEKLGQGFGIHHTTIQLEHEVCETAHSCVIAVPDEREEHDHSGHDHHGHAH